jgi:hypothetical protein
MVPIGEVRSEMRVLLVGGYWKVDLGYYEGGL